MSLPDLVQPLLAPKQHVASLQNGATGFGDLQNLFIDTSKSRKLFHFCLDHCSLRDAPLCGS